MKSIKFIAILLCIIIGCSATITVLMLQNERLIGENEGLQQEIKDYRWQLEQVPYLIESNLESWCNGGYK